MADETIPDTNSTVTEIKNAEPVSDQPKTRATRKTEVSKSKKADGKPGTVASKVASKSVSASNAGTTEPAARKRKKYTPAERTSILASIEKTIKDGATTLKAALQQFEVSEQTYYNWKNAIGKASSTPATKIASDDLTTLVALEAENLKLRRELAAKLRAENAELRKRLGNV
jgi:putative transposase